MLSSVPVVSSTDESSDMYLQSLRSLFGLVYRKEELRSASYAVIHEIENHLREESLNTALGLLIRKKFVDDVDAPSANVKEEATDVIKNELQKAETNEEKFQLSAKLKLVRHWVKTSGLDVFDSPFISALLCRYCTIHIAKRDDGVESSSDDEEVPNVENFRVQWNDTACSIIDEKTILPFAKSLSMSEGRALSSLLLFALEGSTLVGWKLGGITRNKECQEVQKDYGQYLQMRQIAMSPKSAQVETKNIGASGSKKRASTDVNQEHLTPPSNKKTKKTA